MSLFLIIPAAGSGSRFGSKKQFLDFNGRSLLETTLQACLAPQVFERVVVCVPSEDVSSFQFHDAKVKVIAGGQTRAHSVNLGFRALGELHENDVVLIHDAARPLISERLIKDIITMTQKEGAAIPVLAVEDTLRKKEGDHSVTVDRNEFFRVQTPQGFQASLLNKAYDSCDVLNPAFTDEASLVETMGVKLGSVPGDKYNIKITTPDDFEFLKKLL